MIVLNGHVTSIRKLVDAMETKHHELTRFFYIYASALRQSEMHQFVTPMEGESGKELGLEYL